MFGTLQKFNNLPVVRFSRSLSFGPKLLLGASHYPADFDLAGLAEGRVAVDVHIGDFLSNSFLQPESRPSVSSRSTELNIDL